MIRKIDKSVSLVRSNESAMNFALDRMATDVKIKSIIRVPFKSGRLQKSIHKRKVSNRKHQVWVDEEYAAYQEAGMRKDGTRVVRNYSTPGTGKDFLKRAGNQVSDNAIQYFRQAANLVKP